MTRAPLAALPMIALLSCRLIAAPGASPLTVLYDSGQTQPLAPLYEAVGLDDATVAGQPEPAPSYRQDQIDQLRMTVRSEKLTPGEQPRLPTGQAGRMLPRPLFLVGADARSLAWLEAARPRLIELNAVGLIVQSQGAGDLQRIQAAAEGLTLALGSGDTLAEQFGIQHYPVLIGPEWIEQ